MKIEPSQHKPGCLALSPVTDEETAFIRRLSKESSGFLIKTAGRKGAQVNSPLSQRMEIILEPYSGCSLSSFKASDDDTESCIRGLRDALYLGGDGGAYLVESTKQSKKITAHICVQFCKHCKSPIIDRGRAEWKTCSACVSKCEHTYGSGFVSGGAAGNLGFGEFCQICGSGKKDVTPTPLLDNGKILVIRP